MTLLTSCRSLGESFGESPWVTQRPEEKSSPRKAVGDPGQLHVPRGLQKPSPNELCGAWNQTPAGIFRISAGSRVLAQTLLQFWSDLDGPPRGSSPSAQLLCSTSLAQTSSRSLMGDLGSLKMLPKPQLIINRARFWHSRVIRLQEG